VSSTKAKLGGYPTTGPIDKAEGRRVRRNIRLTKIAPEAEKLATLGQLTIGIAHDFNNLLGIIVGNLDLIEPDTVDEDTRLRRQEALGAAQRGATLTQRLLALARNHLPQREPVDIRTVLTSAADIFRTAIGETIELSVEVLDGTWNCSANVSELENALLNLVVNARDALPRSIRVSAQNLCIDGKLMTKTTKLPAGHYVKLSVADDGVGMSDEIIARAFEPFFTTKANGKGNGVGLAMVYDFARRANGDVWIESNEGCGTIVHMCLPRAHEARQAVESLDQIVVPKGDAQPILVVEDDPSLRLVASATIESLGYRIFEAATAREALQLLERNSQIRILFTDILLPGGMNGIELANEAQRRYPGLKVLYASGCADCRSMTDCSIQVSDIILPKPFRVGDIARHLSTLLQSS
jgi:nitrogen-specific signal transduction histidine kinase/CheY-like chemotaxis protein